MTAVVGLTVVGGGALLAWAGIVDPPGGVFAELGRVMAGGKPTHLRNAASWSPATSVATGALSGAAGALADAPTGQGTPAGVGGPSGLTNGGDVAHAALRVAGLTRALAALGSACAPDSCLHFVRTCYSAPGGVHDAELWWHNAPHRHPGDIHAPAGAPVAWTNGGNGHVAIADGLGNVISTDFPIRGRIGRLPISHIGGRTLRFAGWAEPDFGPGT